MPRVMVKRGVRSCGVVSAWRACARARRCKCKHHLQQAQVVSLHRGRCRHGLGAFSRKQQATYSHEQRSRKAPETGTAHCFSGLHSKLQLVGQLLLTVGHHFAPSLLVLSVEVELPMEVVVSGHVRMYLVMDDGGGCCWREIRSRGGRTTTSPSHASVRPSIHPSIHASNRARRTDTHHSQAGSSHTGPAMLPSAHS